MRAEISDLIRCSAVFLPGDPARSGRIALWQADGTPPGTPGTPSAPAAQAPGAAVGSDAFTELTVVTSDLRRTTVRALVLTVDEALPLLTRARAGAETGTGTGTGKGPGADGAGADGAAAGTVFWGAAALLALRFAARGKLLPGLSPAGHDAWRIGPLEAADLDEVRALAAAMPPGARCLPLNPEGPPRLPAAEPLLRAFLD
ncbi:ATP-dependent helicase, partial [Streptomyces virginiae]